MNDEFEDKLRFGVSINLAWHEAITKPNIMNNEQDTTEWDLIIKRAFEIKQHLITPAWNEYAHKKDLEQKAIAVKEAKKQLIL